MKLILQLPGPDPIPDQLLELLLSAGYKVVRAESLTKDSPDVVMLDKSTWIDLSKRASDDFLTDTLNRATFTRKAEGEILKANHCQEPTSCVLIDIDFFKGINDTYGHSIGDVVLQTVAQLIKVKCRSTDLVGRYGGEEFVLLFPTTPLEQAEVVAERLRKVIAETPIPTTKGSVSLTISVGVAGLQPEETFASLVDRADQALYLAKNSGRNQVCVHTGYKR